MNRVIDGVSRYLSLETEVWHFTLAVTLLTVSNGLVSAFLSVAMRQMGASFMEIGIVAALFNLTLAVSVFLGGSMSGKYGGKKMFLLSMFCTLFGMLLYATTMAVSNWLIIASGMLIGRIAWGLRDTSSFSIISNSANENRKATTFGLLYTFSFAGSIMASITASAVAFYFEYSVLFFLALPLIVLSIVVVFLKLEKGEIASKKIIPSWQELKAALTIEKSVTVLISVAFVEQFFAEFGNPYYYIYMKENLQAPEWMLPVPQMTFALSSLTAGALGGHLSDVLKRRKPFIVMAPALSVLGVGMVALATSPYMVIASYVLFGFANVLSFTCLQAYFLDVGQGRGSFIWGTYLASLWVGGILSPTISGAIAEAYGLKIPFLITFSGFIFETVLLLLLFKEKVMSKK